jgi:uncharacterized membrane protein YfhO
MNTTQLNTVTSEDNTENNAIRLPSGNMAYILSFLIPVVVLVAVYAARKIYPFGDNCYLRSDMYHQYAPFYSELWNKLANGGSMKYSWNMGLGVNFTALYAYYLSCPLNWLIFIFPQKYMIEIMNVLIILKLALSSLSCTYYLSKEFHTNSISISIFGMFYALSGYIAAYCWNIMWLDCIVLLPLIVLGLTRLVRENKGFLYCISLGLAILSNYYISIMICMFLVFYFIVLMIALPRTSWKEYVKRFLNFALYSLLAGGLSAILLIPELYALTYTVSSNISFPKTLSNYFPIMEMLIRHLYSVEVHTGLEHYPNIYCGVGVFLLFPLYIMNNRISTKEKAGKCMILLMFLIAFNMNIPNFIWHGLHYPNSLPCRQSFIYIFVLLTMCYDAFKDIRYFSKNQLTTALFTALCFLLIAEQMYSGDTYDFKIFYISGIFILVYMFLIYLYRNKKTAVPVFIFLFFLCTILECALNLEATGFSTTGRSSYLSDTDSIDELLDYVSTQDDSFYRLEKFSGYRSKNDDAWHGYRGVSNFSSTANGGLTTFLGALGCEHSTNAYGYNGATFLTSSMLSVKYIFSSTQLTENRLMSFFASNGNRYMYKLNYTLPLGFMVTDELEDLWDIKSTNPFLVQNDFLYTTTGYDGIFAQIPTESISSSSVRVKTLVDQQIYLYVMSGTESVNVYIDDECKNYSIKHNRIIDIGIINEGQEVRVTSDNTTDTISLLAYTIDEDRFIEAYELLNDEGLEISEFDDTHITGTITANEDGLMFTSIPYDKGWHVKVDGEKVDTVEIKEALIGIPLSAGTHTVTFSYTPQGYYLGVAITSICVIMLMIIYLAADSRYKKLWNRINSKWRK